jgi:uncharacterized protein DUF2844
MKGTPYLFLGLLATALATAQPVHATLGEAADSVMTDRKALSAVQAVTTTRKAYTVQEISSDSVAVREYISPSGIVFGIAWNGLTHPDLTLLLGSYTGEYQKSLRQTPRKPGSRFSQIKTDRIVVEKWGHMRNLRGRTYVPSLIPPGVTADEIK